ncbi:MAG: apolipoprotein N-acyltransferase [Planctomycetes bacterium]|nr:apolipoprotein N-acyltransferase [Planctomycetota bacterium]
MTRNKRANSSDEILPPWRSQTLFLATIANVLVWAAFPPLGLFPLAWFAPLAWVRLIQEEKLPGPRPYWVIWFVSAIVWGVLLEGVGRAYWANYFGLVLMGSYLALYQVLFVGLTRIATHRWKLSVVIAAPVVWTGLELVRGYMITGFSMALLGHTQVKVTSLIQIADIVGAYGVSFLIVFVGSCVANSIRQADLRRRAVPLIIAAGTLACVYAYGLSQIASLRQIPVKGSLKVALIQGTEDTILDSDPEAAQQRAIDTFNQYWHLTLDVCSKHDDIELIVWPEGVFSGNMPQLVVQGNVVPPPGSGLTQADVEQNIVLWKKYFDEKTRGAANAFNSARPDSAADIRATYLLVGCDSRELSGDVERIYNAGLLIAPHGEVVGRYDKIHRVLIGEYIPFGDRFPWLYNLMPMPRGLAPGTRPVSFDVHGINVAPSICFEDTVPHLIRRHTRTLTLQGERPDVLVNLTNDGWFWGSGILDLQLNCAIFRAIELRRPFLVAANTGLTASIDSNGIVQKTLPRREPGVVIADVAIRPRASVYERLGDWFAGLCLLVCLALTFSGCRARCKIRE